MERNTFIKYLDLFGLSDNFTEMELKETYRDLAQVWHPDKYEHNERLKKKAEIKLKELNDGYEYLKQILKNGYTSAPYSKNNEKEETTNSQKSNSESYRNSNENKKEKEHYQDVSSKKNKNYIYYVLGGIIGIIIIVNSMNSGEYSQTVEKTVSRTVSSELDEKNGFKNFYFGMTVEEAEIIKKPDLAATEKNEQKYMRYDPSYDLNIGDFPIDRVELRFFKEKLYRIDINFSKYQSEIYESFCNAYGIPYEDRTWTIEGKLIKANSWEGKSVLCTILAENASWDKWSKIVIFNKELYKEANEYELVEASNSIHTNGVENVHLGMDIEEFRKLLKISYINNQPFEQATAVKINPDSIMIGHYKLESITGYFFKKKLYRCDIGILSDSMQETYNAFIYRFPNAYRNDSWTRDNQQLIGMEYVSEDDVALILALASNPIWDTLIFYSLALSKEKEQYEKEAPNRAADDI